MALFHTTVLDNQIKALSTIGSASGSIATFETDKAERLVNLEVAITATGGGGTPVSPIAINGFSACNLSVNGTTETIPFGQTVYGGRLNVGTGVLTIDRGMADLGSLGWTTSSTMTSGIVRMKTPDLRNFVKHVSGTSIVADIMCEIYEPKSADATYLKNVGISVNTIGDVEVYDTNYNTSGSETAFKTAVTGYKLVYELETPFIIQLDSKQIQTIIGTNNIYADTGDIIDLKFVLSVGKAIS